MCRINLIMRTIAYAFLSIIVLSGCSKRDYPENITPKKYSGLKPPEMGNIDIDRATVSAFSEHLSVNSVLDSRKNSSGGLMYRGGEGIGLISAVHLNPAEYWIGDQVGMTFTGYADEFTMLPEWLGQQDNFYLGSLIKGNTITSLAMVALSERSGEYESKPISASISLPGKNVSGTYNPSELISSEFYSRLLLNNNLNELQKASFSFGIQSFTYYDEIRTVFGSNAKVNAIFYSSGSTSTNGTLKISKKTGLVAKFTQKNFSLDMDVPLQGELYDNLNLTALDGHWPAYISSITYGSTGIMTIESDESLEVVNSAYNKAFSVLGDIVSGGSEVTEEEKGVIGRSSMKIYFIGPNGAEAVKSIFSFEELTEYVKKGSTFSAQTPGVPISFKMKSLENHTTLKNHFTIDVPVKPFYVKKEHIEISPRPPSCPCQDLNLTFFADEKGTVPIKVPKDFPFYIQTVTGFRRTGSHRTGFVQEPIYGYVQYLNPDQGYGLLRKSVFLLNPIVQTNSDMILINP
jgi:hypothetical protein